MGSSNGKPVLRDDDVEAIMKTSGMSEQQVRRDFDIFVTQYPTGVFTGRGISSLSTSVCPGAMKPTVFKQMVYKMLPISDAEKMEQHVLRQTCKPCLKRLYNVQSSENAHTSQCLLISTSV